MAKNLISSSTPSHALDAGEGKSQLFAYTAWRRDSDALGVTASARRRLRRRTFAAFSTGHLNPLA
jgi:hypothetical protein